MDTLSQGEHLYLAQAKAWYNGARRIFQANASLVLGHAYSGLGQVANAVAAYEQSTTLYRRQPMVDWIVASPLSELASIAVAQGDQGQALTYIGEVVHILETRPKLEGLWGPLRVYLNCYRVLHANTDPRAEAILETAYGLIRERAAKIDDRALRRSYLENVPHHREIVAAWEASHP